MALCEGKSLAASRHLPAALRPSPVVTAGLWLATLVMAAAGVYGLVVTLCA